MSAVFAPQWAQSRSHTDSGRLSTTTLMGSGNQILSVNVFKRITLNTFTLLRVRLGQPLYSGCQSITGHTRSSVQLFTPGIMSASDVSACDRISYIISVEEGCHTYLRCRSSVAFIFLQNCPRILSFYSHDLLTKLIKERTIAVSLSVLRATEGSDAVTNDTVHWLVLRSYLGCTEHEHSCSHYKCDVVNTVFIPDHL